MHDLRRIARDKPCMVRYPGICNGDTATTVLGHYRLSGVSGMGVKAPDVCGAWLCSACHQWADTHHDAESKVIFLEGCIRTLDALWQMGEFG